MDREGEGRVEKEIRRERERDAHGGGRIVRIGWRRPVVLHQVNHMHIH